jgi:hypothetical protein
MRCSVRDFGHGSNGLGLTCGLLFPHGASCCWRDGCEEFSFAGAVGFRGQSATLGGK